MLAACGNDVDATIRRLDELSLSRSAGTGEPPRAGAPPPTTLLPRPVLHLRGMRECCAACAPRCDAGLNHCLARTPDAPAQPAEPSASGASDAQGAYAKLVTAEEWVGVVVQARARLRNVP